MEKYNNHAYCPLWLAGMLDNRLRRLLHNPTKILKPYIRKDMVAMDVGCGPGVFSIEIAKLLNGTGKVIAVDMQEKMLEIIRKKTVGTALENRIVLHKCSQERVNVTQRVDFVLMFYMVHEVPSQEKLFDEVLPLINETGLLMIVEPKLVTKHVFNKMIDSIKEKGFAEYAKLKIPLSRGVVLKKL
jgi:ubiquinone/menaquinone biosynthesis C-methylase UbiE